MRVEQGEFLLAMNGIGSVVDVEDDAVRRGGEAAAVEIDQATADAIEGGHIRDVLQSRQCRLAHQVDAGHGRAATGDLHRRIGAQCVGVIAILITGRNQHHAHERHVGVGGGDAQGIANVGERQRDHVGDAEAQRDLAQHDDAAVRRAVAAVEGCCERLARDG